MGVSVNVGDEDGLKILELKLSLDDGYVDDTRSILPEESIEFKMTDATFASYDSDGSLVNTLYYSSLEDTMLLYVSGGSANNVYVLVNMGDMTRMFPEDESRVDEITYFLDSYERVAQKGIPMCGVLKGCAYEEGVARTIGLERLFAKLNVRILHTGLDGGQTSTAYAYNLANKSLYLRQANRRMLPFAAGGSRAETEEDILSLSDYNPNLADMDEYKGSLTQQQIGPGLAYIKDTTIALFVPENIHGCLLPDNVDPFDKVPERLSEEGRGIYGKLCTYLEYNASKPPKSDGYHGDVMYRYFLGENNVADFSVRRNSRYDLTLNFTDGGFLMDSWKVVRGEGWVDSRVLCFLDDPYVIYPGKTINVMVHYNVRTTSLQTGSSGPLGDLSYEFDDSGMRSAGLSCVFMGEQKIQGSNGFSDHYFRVTASENAKVGEVFPIKVMLNGGVKSDVTAIRVSDVGDLVPVWSFCPEYVSQTGDLKVSGAIEDFLPLSANVTDPSVVACESVADDVFRFTAIGEGRADIIVSNSDGSQTLTIPVSISAPVLNLSETDMKLSPDGAVKRLEYRYTEDDGEVLTNVDESVSLRYLKPMVAGCDFIASNVSGSYIDVYISRLKSAGAALKTGSYYQISVGASGCDAVESRNVMVYVKDPFEGIGTVSVGPFEDYTLFGLSGVHDKVSSYFASELSRKIDLKYAMPPVDAERESVSATLAPIWLDTFSNKNEVYGVEYDPVDPDSSLGASLRVFQNKVTESTSHSVGRHGLKLHVTNIHSGESISKVIADVDVYVHTAIGAKAAFDSFECNSPSGSANGAVTVAGVYNELSGIALYNVNSIDRIYYMDVSVDFLTPYDRVLIYDAMHNIAAVGSSALDAMEWITPSVEDGFLQQNQRLLYSVCVGGGQRFAVCGEPYGYRRGVGVMLYRALAMSAMTSSMTDAQLKQAFLGYSPVYGGGLASYAPVYDIHDMNVSTDMKRNVVSKTEPYYLSPRSCVSNRDSLGRGYHVVHNLAAMFPKSCGWVNLL